MAKADLNKKITAEFSKIFDEYYTKISEITQQLPPKMEPISSDSHAEVPTPVQNKQVPGDNATQPEKPNFESVAMVTKARREAQQIISEAEESARREARKRTNVQVSKIMRKAQRDAEDIVYSTRLAAEREKKEALAKVQQQCEIIVRDITEKARQETQARASQIVINAQEKTNKMMADIINSSTEFSHALVDAVNLVMTTVSEFRAKLQTQTDELADVVSDSQGNLKQRTDLQVQPDNGKDNGQNSQSSSTPDGKGTSG